MATVNLWLHCTQTRQNVTITIPHPILVTYRYSQNAPILPFVLMSFSELAIHKSNKIK